MMSLDYVTGPKSSIKAGADVSIMVDNLVECIHSFQTELFISLQIHRIADVVKAANI